MFCRLSYADCRGKTHNEMNVIPRATQRFNATPRLFTLSLDMSVYPSLCLTHEQSIPRSAYTVRVHLNVSISYCLVCASSPGSRTSSLLVGAVSTAGHVAGIPALKGV